MDSNMFVDILREAADTARHRSSVVPNLVTVFERATGFICVPTASTVINEGERPAMDRIEAVTLPSISVTTSRSVVSYHNRWILERSTCSAEYTCRAGMEFRI